MNEKYRNLLENDTKNNTLTDLKRKLVKFMALGSYTPYRELTGGTATIRETEGPTTRITEGQMTPSPLPDPSPPKKGGDGSWDDLSASPPYTIQNDQQFPRNKGYNSLNKLYSYSYQMDYSEINLDEDMAKVRRTINLDIGSRNETMLKNAKLFNRFKIPSLGDAFQKGFGHVFFTRPNCNILNYGGSYQLTDSVENDVTFVYAYKNHLEILKQLCGCTEYPHDFMLYLTNKANGFDISDKTLETDSYGQNLMGHRITYGRTAEKSKTAGTLTVPFLADRDMQIYNLHNYWMRYIAGVYRGKYRPRRDDIIGKVLDYACACYYMVTAEDFETLIYWTKLYGVFPTNTPDNVFAWKGGSPIVSPEPSISYSYSYRSDDKDPKVLLDFNQNSLYGDTDNFVYTRTYQPNRGGLGDTWVEAPFVEYCPHPSGYNEPKLRWRVSRT